LAEAITNGQKDPNISLPGQERSKDMRKLRLILLAVALVAFVMTDLCLAAEYYVVRSRSGLVNVADHQPRGRATAVKGPFGSREEADKAVKELKGTEASSANTTGSGARLAK
jgi:hypothetical protein